MSKQIRIVKNSPLIQLLDGFLLLLLTNFNLFAPSKAELYLTYTRFSVFPGADIVFEANLEDEPHWKFGAWYRDLITTNLHHVDMHTPYCYQNLKNISTLELISLNQSDKYSANWDADDGTGTFSISNVTVEDDGVYCLAVMEKEGDLENAILVAGYLKVTIDQHEIYSTMVIVLVLVSGWHVVIFVGLGIEQLRLHMQQKKTDRLHSKRQKQREMESRARKLQMSEGTMRDVGGDGLRDCAKSAISLRSALYVSTNSQMNMAYLSTMSEMLSSSAPSSQANLEKLQAINKHVKKDVEPEKQVERTKEEEQETKSTQEEQRKSSPESDDGIVVFF